MLRAVPGADALWVVPGADALWAVPGADALWAVPERNGVVGRISVQKGVLGKITSTEVNQN